MDEFKLAECDYSDPESVVQNFIVSMNRWETYAHNISRESDADYWPEIHRSQKVVFDAFCTPKDRKHGRLGSFQKPPEYNPDTERILGSERAGAKRVYVDTHREAVLGGGRYRYVLVLRGERWLIDNAKCQYDGKWKPSIL